MTIEELEALRYLTSEMVAVQKEIEAMYNSYRSPTFEKIGTTASHPGDPTSATVAKVMKLQTRYNVMLNEITDKRDQINAWLCGLEDPEIKSIIRWHYLCGKTWNRTSGLVYGNNNYYNARKVVMRYFGKEK